MTDLYDRLFPHWAPDKKGEKIAHGVLVAYLQDWIDKACTREEIVEALRLDASASSDLDRILELLSTRTSKPARLTWIATLDRIAMLIETGSRHRSKIEFWGRLGIG